MSAKKNDAIVPTRLDWLNQRQEKPLDPHVPIIDPHHHLWERGGEPYHLDQYLHDAQSGHRIDASVYLECEAHYRTAGPDELRSVGEVEWAAQAADAALQRGGAKVCAAIVGHADLRLAARLQPVIDAMLEAGRGRVRGLRNIAAWHPDPTIKGTVANPPPHLLADDAFRRGFEVLATNDLSFETWVLHTQLGELSDLARTEPNVPVIMDHTGGAIGMGPYEGRRNAAFAEWRDAVRKLAQVDNVHAKIGGFGMRLWGFNFQDQPAPPSSEELANAIRPYVETVIDAFGPHRCMFESNFPVDKGSFSFVVLWNAYKRLAAAFSETERDALMRGTAARVYRLNTAS